MSEGRHRAHASRRGFLIGSARLAAGVGLVSMLAIKPSRATSAAIQEAIRKVAGEAPRREGKVVLDLPPLVENGNTVPLTVAVDSPMTEVDHVRAIHVFNEKNPQPNVVTVSLGPRAGRAKLSTRIKLAG